MANAVAVSPDGTHAYVTGYSTGSGTGQDYATIAYEGATGTQLWAASYDGPGNALDIATAVEVAPDGTRAYVTGHSTGSGTGQDYATIAYDATTGAELWEARYSTPFNEVAHAIGVSPDGRRVFVTGGGGGVNDDYVTVAYDAVSGAQLWLATYDGQDLWDEAWGLAVSPDGNSIYVTGFSGFFMETTSYATVEYDAHTGATRWVAGSAGGIGSTATAITISPDGTRVFVTGADNGSTEFSFTDYDTFAFDASTGGMLWEARYNGPGDLNDWATSIGVAPDGSSVYVTGWSYGSGSHQSYDYASVAYDASSGASLWEARYDGSAKEGDFAQALGVSPGGERVYVTGYANMGASGYDYLTVAYLGATGERLWLARNSGMGDDLPTALAVSSSRNQLFVVGSVSNSKDYGTISYRG